jgi:hypothetical protein
MQVFVGAKRTARWLGLKENGLSPQEKLLRRPEDIKPGHDAFREWVERPAQECIDQGSHWQGTLHYAVNQLPLIDPIKNKIRPLALGRKNFLFTIK